MKNNVVQAYNKILQRGPPVDNYLEPIKIQTVARKCDYRHYVTMMKRGQIPDPTNRN